MWSHSSTSESSRGEAEGEGEAEAEGEAEGENEEVFPGSEFFLKTIIFLTGCKQMSSPLCGSLCRVACRSGNPVHSRRSIISVASPSSEEFSLLTGCQIVSGYQLSIC